MSSKKAVDFYPKKKRSPFAGFITKLPCEESKFECFLFGLRFFTKKKLHTKEEFFRELGLEPAAPFSFDVVDCLKRHCSLMKDLTMEEARLFPPFLILFCWFFSFFHPKTAGCYFESVVVSDIVYFHTYLGKWSNLTNWYFSNGLKPPTRN